MLGRAADATVRGSGSEIWGGASSKNFIDSSSDLVAGPGDLRVEFVLSSSRAQNPPPHQREAASSFGEKPDPENHDMGPSTRGQNSSTLCKLFFSSDRSFYYAPKTSNPGGIYLTLISRLWK